MYKIMTSIGEYEQVANGYIYEGYYEPKRVVYNADLAGFLGSKVEQQLLNYLSNHTSSKKISIGVCIYEETE